MTEKKEEKEPTPAELEAQAAEAKRNMVANSKVAKDGDKSKKPVMDNIVKNFA